MGAIMANVFVVKVFCDDGRTEEYVFNEQTYVIQSARLTFQNKPNIQIAETIDTVTVTDTSRNKVLVSGKRITNLQGPAYL